MMIKTYQITPFCEHMLIRFACNHLNGRILSNDIIILRQNEVSWNLAIMSNLSQKWKYFQL